MFWVKIWDWADCGRDRNRQIAVRMRPAWSTQQVLGQPGLNIETVSQKEKDWISKLHENNHHCSLYLHGSGTSVSHCWLGQRLGLNERMVQSTAMARTACTAMYNRLRFGKTQQHFASFSNIPWNSVTMVLLGAALKCLKINGLCKPSWHSRNDWWLSIRAAIPEDTSVPHREADKQLSWWLFLVVSPTRTSSGLPLPSPPLLLFSLALGHCE